jgi:protein-tyrosine phosphatase
MGGTVAEPPPGTRAVLNLCEQEDPYQAEVHRWDPIPDAAPAPDLDWLRRQTAFVDEQRRAGRPVYVHCAAGVSRAGLVTAAYLMQRDGLSRDEALTYLRARRSVVNPNPAFMELLLEWEAFLKRR